MSAFAFMAFAMAVVNAALSTANNVNDNNNNNNNNNNDNNNNLANINVANANNAANNENMAMAGRRRRLQRLQSGSNLSREVELRPELFATRVMLQDEQLVYAPLKIGYDQDQVQDQDQDQDQEETNEPSPEQLASDLPPPLSANLPVINLSPVNLSLIPATTPTLTNSSFPSGKSSPPSSYLDRLLASANSLLGRRRKRNTFESSLEDFDQLEGELAQIALTFIGQMPFI